MATNEAAIPAVALRPARDWWLPLRLSAALVVGLPLLVGGALLCAWMDVDRER